MQSGNTHLHRRRQPRWNALWLPTVLLSVLSILGLYHAIFGIRQTDWQRWRDIARGKPWQDVPRTIETDFNIRFLPSFSARMLVNGSPVHAMRMADQTDIVSRHGYVFVPEDVAVAYGRPFLNTQQKQPRDAICALAALSERVRNAGAQLIVVPVPAKATMLPEELDPAYDVRNGPQLNKGHAEWIAALRKTGVVVVDPTDALWKRREESPLFYTSDTHWTQFASIITAQAVAAQIRPYLSGDVLHESFMQRTIPFDFEADRGGNSPLSPQELTGTCQQLLVDGHPAQFGNEAPVLVMGDSYAEIFADNSAGFPQMLAADLRVPVQSVAEIGVIAYEMSKQLDAPPGLMKNKKVVVLVFSLRKIQCNNWFPIR